jgi:putative Holliday junction resolvase
VADPGAPAAPGRWLGVDVGSVRIGVAVCDPSGVLATPLATVARDPAGGADLRAIAEMVLEQQAVGVVVGLPRTLANREGTAAVAAREFATALGAAAGVPVELSDEQLRQRGVRGRRQRAVVDQAAAVAILQGWLDARRSGTGRSDVRP